MISWHTKEVRIEELKEWEKNPRSLTKVEYNRLLDSLDELGDFSGITVDADNTVVSGNQRLRALREKGVEKILVRCPDRKLTNEEIDKIGLLANRHSGSWDMDMLANEFEQELLESINFSPIDEEKLPKSGRVLVSVELRKDTGQDEHMEGLVENLVKYFRSRGETVIIRVNGKEINYLEY